MKPTRAELVKPNPFFEIAFGCSNRLFYQVKNDLFELAEKINIEIQDGYIEEVCDYEGDLEKIIIYNQEEAYGLIDEVLKFYDVDSFTKLSGFNLVLSIY